MSNTERACLWRKALVFLWFLDLLPDLHPTANQHLLSILANPCCTKVPSSSKYHLHKKEVGQYIGTLHRWKSPPELLTVQLYSRSATSNKVGCGIPYYRHQSLRTASSHKHPLALICTQYSLPDESSSVRPTGHNPVGRPRRLGPHLIGVCVDGLNDHRRSLASRCRQSCLLGGFQAFLHLFLDIDLLTAVDDGLLRIGWGNRRDGG